MAATRSPLLRNAEVERPGFTRVRTIVTWVPMTARERGTVLSWRGAIPLKVRAGLTEVRISLTGVPKAPPEGGRLPRK